MSVCKESKRRIKEFLDKAEITYKEYANLLVLEDIKSSIILCSDGNITYVTSKYSHIQCNMDDFMELLEIGLKTTK